MEEEKSELLEILNKELKTELLGNILPYWENNAMDYKRGGFYGQITFENNPAKNAKKGSILNSRILWTFSACYKQFGDSAMKEVAVHAFEFLKEKFWDAEFGGVFWMLDAKGNISDNRKHIYAEAFTIYALTEYYSAFEDEEALELAKELFNLIESYCQDHQRGGYFEAFSREWKLLDDARLSDKDKNEPKSMNSHLHLLEAYTNLYRYWKTPEVKAKLTHLLDVFADHIVNKNRTSLVTFLGENWEPRSEEISFGHDIEASWLLPEAANVLEDYPRSDLIQAISLNLAEQVKCSMDKEYGGIYNEADPEGITDENKDWWPQAEAMIGFVNAYQFSADDEFLHAAFQIWSFIKEYIIDQEYGEWNEKVSRSGVPYHLDKVRSWKCPYHNGRMVLQIMHRLEQLAGIASDNTAKAVISEKSAAEN